MLPRVRVVAIFSIHVGFPRSLWLGTIFFTSFLLCSFPIWASKHTRLTDDPKISPWISTVYGTCWWPSVAAKAHVPPECYIRVEAAGSNESELPWWGNSQSGGAVKQEGSIESLHTGIFAPFHQKWGLLSRILILYFLSDLLLLLFHH